MPGSTIRVMLKRGKLSNMAASPTDRQAMWQPGLEAKVLTGEDHVEISVSAPPHLEIPGATSAGVVDQDATLVATDVKHSDVPGGVGAEHSMEGSDGMMLTCHFCGHMNDRRLYDCQECKSLMGSPKQTKHGLLSMATQVAQRFAFGWQLLLRGCYSRRRTQVNHKLRVCKRARVLGCTVALDCYAKDATYAYRRTQNQTPTATLWDVAARAR